MINWRAIGIAICIACCALAIWSIICFSQRAGI
jgi:hypothetical protein